MCAFISAVSWTAVVLCFLDTNQVPFRLLPFEKAVAPVGCGSSFVVV